MEELLRLLSRLDVLLIIVAIILALLLGSMFLLLPAIVASTANSLLGKSHLPVVVRTVISVAVFLAALAYVFFAVPPVNERLAAWLGNGHIIKLSPVTHPTSVAGYGTIFTVLSGDYAAHFNSTYELDAYPEVKRFTALSDIAPAKCRSIELESPSVTAIGFSPPFKLQTGALQPSDFSTTLDTSAPHWTWILTAKDEMKNSNIFLKYSVTFHDAKCASHTIESNLVAGSVPVEKSFDVAASLGVFVSGITTVLSWLVSIKAIRGTRDKQGQADQAT